MTPDPVRFLPYTPDVETIQPQEAEDVAADARRGITGLVGPDAEAMFDHVYREPHPLIDEQRAWIRAYEESYGDSSAADGTAAKGSTR